ncbi:MAG TPA: type VI secretion system protein TssA [Pirellulales bacterium]
MPNQTPLESCQGNRMAALDFTSMLDPLSAEAPCGPNLEYDAEFGAMQRAGQGKPEQQFGATIVPAEEPNWREMQEHALALMGRSKDLRVAVELARATLSTTGVSVFCEALWMLAEWIDRYWDTLHPQLDPEDNNDPVLRANTLAALADPSATLNFLLRAPLVSSRAHGRFSLRDVMIAEGDTPAPAGMASPPTTGAIEAAFSDSDPAELQQLAARVQGGVAAARHIMAAFNERVGAADGLQFGPLAEPLVRMQGVLDQQLLRLGVSAGSDETAADTAAGGDVPAAKAAAADGEINSREDVVRMLDRICLYYARHEPSSPIPLLLRRAKRLTSASFMDILRDLAPAGIDQAETIGGPGGAESGEET